MLREKDKRMRKDNRGFTIVELLIAVAILAIVVVAVSGFIVVGSRSYASANSDISVQQEAQLAMNQMSDVLIDTTRSVNYVGYETIGSDAVPVLKDSEFGFEPVGKSLIMYNGVPVETTPASPGGTPASPTIDPGNGNKHYQFYWDKAEETLYYAELDVLPDDVDPEGNINVRFPELGEPADPSDPTKPGWVVLAEHVTKFEVDLTQVEEKRVVQLELTFVDGKREYNTSNNVTIRNRVAVNDAEVGPLNKRKTLSIIARETAVILEPGETYHFSTPKVTGENVTDKSVKWSVVSSGSPSGGTQFTDEDNGILKIAPDEPAGTIELKITTNAVDSDNNHASCKVLVYIKRVTTLGLYKSADTNDENGPNEISPGCTFTISTNVDGPRLGETCSACGESTEKDRQVSCEGNKYNSNFPWRIVDPQEYDPSMAWWKPKDYLKLISQDEHSATFYLEPNTPDDGSFKFVIQAMSLLSVCPNEQGRCQYYFGEAIELTSVKGKENAKPYSGALQYGTQELKEEVRQGLPTDHGRYVTCVRVVDNSHQFEDKVLLYYTIGGGNNLRIVPDMFDLDLNGSYTFYIQALDPVSIETRKLKEEGKIKEYIEDSKEDIWKYYWEGVDENTKPYGYNGDRYLHGDVFYATLNKPKLTYTYKNVDYKGTNITYDPVNVYAVGEPPIRQILIGEIHPKQGGYENIVDDNQVWNLITNSLYEGKGDDISKWNKVYCFDETKLNVYPDKSIEDMVQNDELCYEGTKEFAGKVTIDPKGNIFMKLTEGNDVLGACGEYHIVPGMVYQNKRYKESDYEIIGARNFDYYAEHKRRYYQFDDSTIHVKVTNEFTMDIANDDWFNGKVLFPLPSQMAGDVLFPNLQSTQWQISAGSWSGLALKGSKTETMEFTYVRYMYSKENQAYYVEPIKVEVRGSESKIVTHSYGVYYCEENGTKWVFQQKGYTTEKALVFTVKDFEYESRLWQTYFPLPDEPDFPLKGGLEETYYNLSLYQRDNISDTRSLSGVLVKCTRNDDDAYEIKFIKKIPQKTDWNPNNHKIRVISYGTYTWSKDKRQTEWTKKAGAEELEPETDFVPNLTELQVNGNTYKMYFPLPTEGNFPFNGTGEVKPLSSFVLYLQDDKYAENGQYIHNPEVRYEIIGDKRQLTFFLKEWNGEKCYGTFQWDGQNSWTKVP